MPAPATITTANIGHDTGAPSSCFGAFEEAEENNRFWGKYGCRVCVDRCCL